MKIVKLHMLERSYWGNNGKHQSLYDELWKNLVPESGDAPTLHGELLRAIAKIYHDYWNNGCCNMGKGDPLREWVQMLWRFRSLFGSEDVQAVCKRRAEAVTLERVADRVILFAGKVKRKEWRDL